MLLPSPSVLQKDIGVLLADTDHEANGNKLA